MFGGADHNGNKFVRRCCYKCAFAFVLFTSPCPLIDSIMRLNMTAWRITGKIIRTAIVITYVQL